jgi:hypothetical protein
MYVGPGMTDIGLQNNSTFRNGKYPAAVQARINENPGMQILFVRTSSLAQAMQDLKAPTSAIAQVNAYFTAKFKAVAPVSLV